MRVQSRHLKVLWVLAFAAFLTACSTTGDKVSVDYYQIKGNSTAALDKDIRRKGPKLDSGAHAIAVARIKMRPRMRYATANSQCRVASAKVDVNARITLPEWKGRKTATAEMARAWDNVDRYARLHEAVHVAIAFKHARLMEAAILQLQAEPNCRTMQARVSSLFVEMLEDHDREQKKFDADEQKRIASSMLKRRG
ncbi:DUF922 domain-containing protein [Pseudahrensia aquimaris]|uniref:DUF922 domain-containing protein n=1 Tax=Pseudahrensia aquimaris TaxID=744461 RepID=A0ABW3FHH7_9HYPH